MTSRNGRGRKSPINARLHRFRTKFLENKKEAARWPARRGRRGSAKGNRTPVSGVRGRRPGPLDDGATEGGAGEGPVKRNGWGGRTRTHDLLGQNQTCCQLHHSPATSALLLHGGARRCQAADQRKQGRLRAPAAGSQPPSSPVGANRMPAAAARRSYRPLRTQRKRGRPEPPPFHTRPLVAAPSRAQPLKRRATSSQLTTFQNALM